MKKSLALLTLAATLFTSAASAQQPQGTSQRLTPQQRAERLTETMTKRLVLDAEQTEKVRAINLKYADEARAVKDARKEEKGAKPGALRDLRAEKNAELKEVLTAEQYAKWEQMEDNMAERRKARHQAKKADTNEQQAPTTK